MKKALAILIFAASPIIGLGQTTSVTATVTDSASTNWNNATCTATWIGTGRPIDLNGKPFTTSPTCTVNGSAALSVTVQDVAYIAPPSSTWKFCVTPATSQAVTYCTNIAATGASESISTQLTAAISPPVVTGGPLAKAYNDGEVQAVAGNQYFRLSDNTFRCYTTSWAGCGGGGGAVSITSSTGDLTVSPSPLTGTGTIDLNLAHANTWTGQQTFVAPILGTPASGVITNLTGTCTACYSAGFSLPATVSGTATSGGVLYLASTTSVASSALLAANHVLLGGGAGTAPSSDANLDDGATTPNTLTYAGSGGLALTGTSHGITIPAGTAVGGASGNVVYAVDSTNGYGEINENNTGLSRICTAANSVCAGATLPTGTTGQGLYYASGGTTVSATSAIYHGGASSGSPVGIGTTSPVTNTDLDNNVLFNPTQVPSANTTLSSSATSSQTTLSVASTTGYPTQGILIIGAGSYNGQAELVTYTGTSGGNTFTGVTRGAFGTTGTAQNSGNAVQLITEAHAETLTSTPFYIKIFNGGAMFNPSMANINNVGASTPLGDVSFSKPVYFFNEIILAKDGNDDGQTGSYIYGLYNGFTLSNFSNATTVYGVDGYGTPGYLEGAIAVTAGSTSIAPVTGVVDLTGTAPTALATITVPSTSSLTICSNTGISCQVTIIGVGATTVTTGNIANVVSAKPMMICTYLLSATKWYCE